MKPLESGENKTSIGLAGIGAITIIVCVGLATGHNSVLTGTGMAVIGAIVGGLLGFSVGRYSA